MVRTVQSSLTHNHTHHLPDDVYDDVVEDISTPTAHASSLPEAKNSEGKPSHLRSKHSETEQRRRSKINERFQILRDLIPPNDQKRDKASLLLEVIEYIQFLQEKLEIYEGPCQQVLSQETTTLIPWRANHEPVETSANHSHMMKNGSMGENIAAQPLPSMQVIVEPDFSAEYAYRVSDYSAGSSNAAASLNIPFHPFVYPSIKSNAPAEKLASEPHGLSVNECAAIANEDRTSDSGSNSLSSVYSQGLLKKLTEALQTSGVDMSHANISVQLDVGKRASNVSSIAASMQEIDCQDVVGRQYSGEVSRRDFGAPSKKLRTGES